MKNKNLARYFVICIVIVILAVAFYGAGSLIDDYKNSGTLGGDSKNNEPVITTPIAVAPTSSVPKTQEPKNPDPTIKVPKVTNSLIVKKWFWIKTQMNDGKIVTPKQLDRFALLFTKEGKFTALTDCNSVGGEYKTSNVTASGGNLQLMEMMSTLMYCEGSQEQEFNKMLSESGKYMFDKNGQLILLLNYDSGSMFFEGR